MPGERNGLDDNYNEIRENLKRIGISSTDFERVTSFTSVLKYLKDNRYVSVNRQAKVLDIGTGSGVGVFAWRQLGIPEANITAIDVEDVTKPVLLGQSTFLKEDAYKYLTGLPYDSFDVISALRIPRAEHNYTENHRGGRKEWLYYISRALKDKNSFYLETYSEWLRAFPSDKNGILNETHLSFMGDKLETPHITLLSNVLPKEMMMGHPDGVYEENNWLDRNRWVPCKPDIGEPKPLDFSSDRALQDSLGRLGYHFGTTKLIDYVYGYKDNLVVLYNK